MKYRINTSFNWYQTDYEKILIKVYYINGIAFTFDEIEESEEIEKEANDNMIYTPIDFYNSSFYLIDEEAHPMLFEIEIENPELLEEIK